jgi:peptide/nickel transport system substrate-binding protein
VGRIVFASICDKLFDIDEKLNVVPQLALSHETSPDGKTVTIRLRPGVKFHDGEAFDAEAAKYSLERHMTMPGSTRRAEISAIDRIEIVDPLTIRLVLKTPYAPLIAQLTDRAGMMVAPQAAKDAGDKFGLRPVCAGPYRFVERVQQDRIVVEKFADYWNKDNVHIDRIVYLPIVDATVRLANLKSGGLDIAERMLATDIKDIRADKRLRLASALWLGYQGITINVGDNPRAKATPLGRLAKVRQALSLAVDRDAINQVVFNGEFVPGNQWVNPEHPYYQKAFPVQPRDVAQAKALMREAGVTAPFTVDFMVPKGAENEAIAEMIQAMAKDIGIDMKIRVTEFATSLKQAEAAEFQAFLLDWSGRTDPDGNSYSHLTCKGPLNYSALCNADLDRLANEARTIADVAQRKAVYEKMTKLILEESPIVYLYHRRSLFGLSARVEGYRQVSDGMIRVVGLRLK